MLTLRSDRATATIDVADGGRLTSLVLDGLDLIGSGTPAPGMPPGWYHGSFPMVPYAGRVKDGVFSFRGGEHVLPANAGPHSGHGLVFDVPWQLVASSERSIEARAALDARWPFGGYAHQGIELDAGGLTMTLTVHNPLREMPCALGFHPWFRRDLGHGPVLLQFDPVRRLAPADDGFPRVPTCDPGTRPWDDVFMGPADPELHWPGGPAVAVRSDAPWWIVYERQESGICVEPITAPPDTLGSADAQVVGPGRPLSLEMRLEWLYTDAVEA